MSRRATCVGPATQQQRAWEALSVCPRTCRIERKTESAPSNEPRHRKGCQEQQLQHFSKLIPWRLGGRKGLCLTCLAERSTARRRYRLHGLRGPAILGMACPGIASSAKANGRSRSGSSLCSWSPSSVRRVGSPCRLQPSVCAPGET